MKEWVYTIRAATPEDSASLAMLRVALFREVAPARGTTHQPLAAEAQPDAFALEAQAAFRDGLAHGSCLAWIAETREGQAVGSVAMLIFPRLPSPELAARLEGYLLNVYTVPSWRRRGIAAALVVAALDRARDLGLARVRLHATAEGRFVYLAAGFRAREDEMEWVHVPNLPR